MQDEHRFLELHGVDRAVGAARVIFDHFQDAGAAEALEQLRRVVPIAVLGEVQGVTEELPHVGESQAIGEGLLEQARTLFEWWHHLRDGTLTREGFAAVVVEIRAAVQQWLAEGAAYEAAGGISCPGADRANLSRVAQSRSGPVAVCYRCLSPP